MIKSVISLIINLRYTFVKIKYRKFIILKKVYVTNVLFKAR